MMLKRCGHWATQVFASRWIAGFTGLLPPVVCKADGGRCARSCLEHAFRRDLPPVAHGQMAPGVRLICDLKKFRRRGVGVGES